MTFQSPALEPNDIPDSSAPSEKTIPSSNAWLRSHRQAAIDFRKRWRSCAFWWLATFWFGGLIFGLFALSTAGTVFLGSYLPCLPDGSFAVDPSTFRYFSSSGFFEITMAFGKMTFTQAKAIDVVWDIVVGRGGQAMIVFVSWRVFANYVTTSMEVAPITFRTYRAIFLPGGSLLSGIPNMIYDFATRHGLHSKIAMVFMVYTMIFALIYPTIAGAMAGYNGNVQAFVNTTDSNYVPFRSFEYAFFVIHDGERIGKGNEYVITDTLGSRGEPPAEPTIYGQGINTLNCFASFYAPYHPEACYVQSNVSSYIRNYGLNGKNNTNTTFMGIDLPPPALNISAFHLPERIYNSVMPMNLRTTTTLQRYNDTSPITWYYGNVTYTQDEMQHRGKCQALLDYQWGFSFVQLFIMLILCIIWTIGTYTMWLRAHVLMRRRGRTEIAGDHLAILELADAMRNQGLDIHNNTSSGGKNSKVPGDVAITVTSTGSSSANMPPTYEFTESTLRNRVAADLRGGSISYITPLLSNGGEESRDWNILGWLLRNKFSILGMAVCIAASATSGVMLAHYIMILVPLPLELGTALYIGSTRGSRIVVFYQALLVCSVLPQVVAIICTVLYRKPY